MQHAVYYRLAEKNELEPKHFQIFLSGGAGAVGRSILVNAISQNT